MTESFKLPESRWPSELKLAREEQQISVALVSEQAGIPPRVIRALEHDGGQSLAPLYRRAYLQKYAAFLGLALPADPLNDGSGYEPLRRVPRLAMLGRQRGQSQGSIGWIRYLVASVLVVPSLLWVLIDQGAHWVTGGLEQAQDTGPTPMMEVRHIRASQLPARPMSGSGGDQDGSGVMAQQANEAGVAVEASVMPETFLLSLMVVGDGWVEVRDATGKKLEHDLLRQDTERTYQGEPPFELLLGKGQLVRLALNGQPVDHLTEPQGSSDLTQARQGVMAFRVLADGRVENQR